MRTLPLLLLGLLAGCASQASEPRVVSPRADAVPASLGEAPSPPARPEVVPGDHTPAATQEGAEAIPARSGSPAIAVENELADRREVRIEKPVRAPAGNFGQTLGASRLGERLRQANFAGRLALLDELEQQLADNEAALTTLRGADPDLDAAGQKQFRAVCSAAEDRVNVLRRSLRAARNSQEIAWPLTRAQLVAEFDTFADVLGRLDALLAGPAR